MRKILVRTAALLAPVVVALAAVLVGNAVRVAGGEGPAPAATTSPAVDAERLAAVLAGAVRIPTVSEGVEGPSAESLAALRDHLTASFPRVFAALAAELREDGTWVLTWAGSAPALPPILLLAHQDVVPVPGENLAQWTRPPFAGEIADGFVWGRGALDDKGSLVGLLAAVDALLAEGFAPRRTVMLALGPDEEVGGAGQRALAADLAARGVRPALVLDEGMPIGQGLVPGVARPVALIGVAEKGYVSFELAVEVAGGHSSMPLRESAISILSAALARLTAEPLPARADAPVWSMLAAVAPAADFPSRVAFANLWLLRPLVARQLAAAPASDAMLRTTLAPTLLRAGVKENVLAPSARAVVNLRILPGDTRDGLEAEIRRRLADERVRITTTAEGAGQPPSRVSSTAGWGWSMLARSVREEMPEAVVAPALMIAATDARHYDALSDQVFRFFPVVLEPSDTARFHGVDERVGIDNLARAARIYARLIANAAGPGGEG
jgi:carboxypeptidase PM20D1